MNTGSLFKTMRMTTGLTQAKFAKKYAINIDHLKRIEAEIAYPSINMIMRLEVMLDITVHFSVECDYKVQPRVKRRKKGYVNPDDIKVFDAKEFFED